MRKKKKDYAGAAACALFFVFVLAFIGLLENCAGEGHPGGVRGTLSADWHHAKCTLKPCDEDGRCPVWSHTYSKCYMLDDKEGEDLKEFEGSKAKKGMFELYMLEVKGRKI